MIVRNLTGSTSHSLKKTFSTTRRGLPLLGQSRSSCASPPTPIFKPAIHEPSAVKIANSTNDFGEKAAAVVIETIRKNPNAVIILPTGSTPGPMYKKIIEEFKKDASFDLSGVTFFNLDEYIGLPKNHPLSYNFYMENALYKHLRVTDPARAPKPENIHIPYVDVDSSCFDEDKNLNGTGLARAHDAARQYREDFLAAIEPKGKADLVVLGIGGAYPDKASNRLKGGHIGFNEPGSELFDITRPIELSLKTIGDTRYRFRNIDYLLENDLLHGDFSSEVPNWAITIGIDEIVNHTERALLLANGEEKAPVIEEFFKNEPNPDFPATYLKHHSNYEIILDTDAASNTPHIRRPWEVYGNENWNESRLRQLLISSTEIKSIDELKIPDLKALNVNDVFLDSLGDDFSRIKEDARTFLKERMQTDFSQFNGKNVLITSPHPDDDVICAATTIKKLKEAGANVKVAYVTNGENAVRRSDCEQYLPGDFATLTGKDQSKALKNARIKAREVEAVNAVKKLGLSEANTVFLRSSFYYTRGFVDIDPLAVGNDVSNMKDLITDFKPDYIFYSAENDPHGAHGLSAKTIKAAIRDLDGADKIQFWGYRGAYNEWPLHEEPEKLKIVSYDEDAWNIKKAAIDEHISQKNPLFPSFDKREFDERAHDRNMATGKVLQSLGYSKNPYAEVFKTYSSSEFLAA